MHKVEFYIGDKLRHSKDWDLGLEAAKQHAEGMAKPYGATLARVLDHKGREVFVYTVPGAPGVAEAPE